MRVFDQVLTEEYAIYHGDCVEVTKGFEDNSIHYSIFSPPFSSLYTYSNSDRDMGNSKNDDEFYKHFKFLVKELYRILIPGRLVSFHCMNLPTTKAHDGYIGIRDFRGEMIKLFEEEGFIYHSEVCIWKDPVIAMQRTKALGLLHRTIRNDSAMSRQGIPDYVVTMRKPGDNPIPIEHTHETYPVSKWQKVASPIWNMPFKPDELGMKEREVFMEWWFDKELQKVWMDINQSNTLQRESAREEKDEKHIAPLQLDVIERCIDLWTNEGEIVFSPFGGIGSEPYKAVEMHRKGVAVELKASYFDQMKRNLEQAVINKNQGTLFDEVIV